VIVAPVSFSLAELAARVGGAVHGDGAARIGRVAPLETAGPGDIAFFSNKKYRDAYLACRATAVVVEAGAPEVPGVARLEAANAYLAFARISTLFHPPPRAVAGVSPQAAVHPSAAVDPSAELGAFVSVGPGVRVGARTILHPGVCLGEGARVGSDCILYSNVVVRDGCAVGDRVILQPGCVVGADGFGFAFDARGEVAGAPQHYKVPQVGAAVIEDDVELGANTCVDRGALGDTVIGRGTKIDNLVQIGHNVRVGPLSIVVAHTAVAGSTKIGTGVVLAGQVGIAGHVEIGDGARIGAQSGILGDVPAGATVSGTPAQPHHDWLRSQAALHKLPELVREVRRLREEIAQLKGKP
jgi:UDP-3-O-[3-hydroxymyristoyl] glucosamine N-acyltransferase